MPSGDAAHNAAHCEPTPGDWPEGMAPQMAPADAVSPDEPLDAIHAMGAAHGTSHSGKAENVQCHDGLAVCERNIRTCWDLCSFCLSGMGGVGVPGVSTHPAVFLCRYRPVGLYMSDNRTA